MVTTHTINARETNPDNEFLKIIGKHGADVEIDNTGNVDIIRRA